MSHNLIDHSVMSSVLGMTVSRQDFVLEEDRNKNLAPGVIWRRRRFRFLVEETDAHGAPVLRPEGLCINELSLDSNAQASLSPRLAAEYPDLLDLAEVENAYWATTFAKGAIRDSSAASVDQISLAGIFAKDVPIPNLPPANVRATRLYLNMGAAYYGDDSDARQRLLDAVREVQILGHLTDELAEILAPLDPTIVEQPAGGFGVARYLPAFPSSRLVQSSPKILAATNAGYFLNFPEEYDDGVSALHQALGGHMVKGRLVAPPWIARPGYIGFEDGRIIDGIFGPGHLALHVDGLPPLALHQGRDGEPQHAAVWRSFDQDDFAAADDAVALLFTGDLLVDVVHAALRPAPPKGGAVVIVTGEYAAAALAPDARRRISVRLANVGTGKPEWMISAGPFLVADGKAVPAEHMLTEKHAGEFRLRGPAPTRFPYDTGKTRAPRTGLGRTSSGGMKMIVVDGRRPGEHSCGVTLEGLAALMAWVGCETAINLDGGGSSVMAIEGADATDRLRENLPQLVVNVPSDGDGQERIVPIFVVVEGR